MQGGTAPHRPAEGRVVPTATYRFQVHGGFTFDHAAEQASYLDALGVSHAYLSPVLQPAAGSTHGYDVVNHDVVNEEAGGGTELARLSRTLSLYGLGVIVDVVPNVDILPDVVVPSVVLPNVDVIPNVDVLPIGTKVVAGTVNMGLTPPGPSSLAPIVIPVRPTADAEAIPVGDEADAAAPDKELPAIVGQIPDAVPAMPPPSNTVVDPEV